MTGPIGRRALLVGAGGLAASAGIAACGSSAAAGAKPSTVPSGTPLVMIIRHGEKPTGSGKPYGVAADGTQDSESLTTVGWSRAGALIGLFDPPGTPRTGLARPDRVIAARPGGGGSNRPYETVTPLAARLGNAIGTTWSVGQEKALATHLPTLDGCTLVAWEHKHIPDIAAALGSVSPKVPHHWPGGRFDVVWCFRRSGDGWTFYQVPQELLAGDSSKPI